MNRDQDEHFIVAPLAPAAIPTAFPLVRLALPGTSMQAWRLFARNAIGSGKSGSGRTQGILTLRRPSRAHLCGLVWYGYTADLEAGRVLEARHLIAVDIVDPTPLIRSLTGALQKIAEREQCTRVRILLPDQADLAASITRGGFATDGRVLSCGVPSPDLTSFISA
jgi:hypothetical protein